MMNNYFTYLRLILVMYQISVFIKQRHNCLKTILL